MPCAVRGDGETVSLGQIETAVPLPNADYCTAAASSRSAASTIRVGDGQRDAREIYICPSVQPVVLVAPDLQPLRRIRYQAVP